MGHAVRKPQMAPVAWPSDGIAQYRDQMRSAGEIGHW